MRAKSVVSTFRTALCVPLPGHDGRPVGMVQLDRRTGKKGFKAGDLDLLAALAVPVGVAVENHWLLKERASWAAAVRSSCRCCPAIGPRFPGTSSGSATCRRSKSAATCTTTSRSRPDGSGRRQTPRGGP